MTSTPGAAFGIPTDPTTFDVDTWIANAGRPQRTVTIYGRADLIARLDEIDTEVKTIRRRLNAHTEQSLDEGGQDETRITELEEEWETLATTFSQSALPVVVRGLTEAEEADALKAATKSSPLLAKAQNAQWHELVGLYIVHAAIVSPDLTLAQIIAIHQRIGAAAFGPLANTVRALTRQAPAVPPTPFSKPSSRADQT